MSTLMENLRLAKGAIQYLNKLNIASTNVPFRLGSYAPLSRLDSFLFWYMRQETHYSPEHVETQAKHLQIGIYPLVA